MAIATLYGNLTPTEKFISSTMDGAEMVHMARTKMIQEVYAANSVNIWRNLLERN